MPLVPMMVAKSLLMLFSTAWISSVMLPEFAFTEPWLLPPDMAQTARALPVGTGWVSAAKQPSRSVTPRVAGPEGRKSGVRAAVPSIVERFPSRSQL
jgi:hypothetical protein